jgi:AraC-like DNA-binding protein
MRRRGVDVIVPSSDDFFARTNFVELASVGLYYVSNKSPIRVMIPARGAALAHLCLRGEASLTIDEHRITIAEGATCIGSPDRDQQLEFGADLELMSLRIPRDTLDRTLASLTGFPPQIAIEFEPLIDPEDQHYAGFRELLMLLAGRLDPTFSAWPKATLAQLEQACVTSLLYCSRHNFRRFLVPAAADGVPIHVRHAEHYVESHCEDDVSAGDMARAARVSVSTLTRAFVKHRGYTPSAFIKRVRLTRAKALLEAGAATTVIGVALRCGFAHPSRFAKVYREAFGESPTDTLRRTRSRLP